MYEKLMKGALGIVVITMFCTPVTAQTRINVDKPRVNVGDVNSNSTSRAEQRVTGVDANVQTYFEASDIPANTRSNATVKNVPDAVAPSIVGGNPCMVSASVGGSGVGFGFGVGIGIEDEGCETRQVTALLSNMGDRQAAFFHLCMHNSQVQDSILAMGFNSCAEYVGVVTPGVARQPSAAANPQVSSAPVSVPPAIINTRPAPSARPAATSITLREMCSDADYRRFKNGGYSWSEWSPPCRARHENAG